MLDALRQAVLAAPDDDLPRLVFADYLEESGDPDRAQFIRVQVELAKTPEYEPLAVLCQTRKKEWLTGEPWFECQLAGVGEPWLSRPELDSPLARDASAGSAGGLGVNVPAVELHSCDACHSSPANPIESVTPLAPAPSTSGGSSPQSSWLPRIRSLALDRPLLPERAAPLPPRVTVLATGITVASASNTPTCRPCRSSSKTCSPHPLGKQLTALSHAVGFRQRHPRNASKPSPTGGGVNG